MYDEETRSIALLEVEDCGGNISKAAEALGIPRKTISRWMKKPQALGRKPHVYLSYEEKVALARRLAAGENAEELGASAGVCGQSVRNWLKDLLKNEEVKLMSVEDMRREVPDPDMPNGDDVEALRRRVYELELENAVLAGTIDIIKKDPGADVSSLTNREKATLARALKNKFWLKDVLDALELARSTYYAQLAAMGRPDKYAELRIRIREIFEAKRRAWGSERIWAELRNPHDGGDPVTVSEKVVRRIMREGDMVVVYNKKKRAYSSYKGEISAHPGNKVNRNFHADAPNRLWLTDITQFTLPDFKCYLAPVIDCFDGRVVAHRMSLSPNAELANSMLEDACATLSDGEHPISHSDCGCHYRWPGWIEVCEKFGLVRSMSKKGCSPDNSACEGFFGRLKNEMFYERDWKGVSFEKFSAIVDDYIRDYNETRIKKSLGWMSPNEYRRSMGIAA